MMEGKSIIVGLIVGLLVGFGLGYGVAPRADTFELEAQLADLEAQIADLEARIEDLEALISLLRRGEWNLMETFTGVSGFTTDLFFIPGAGMRLNWTWTPSTAELAEFSIALNHEFLDFYIEIWSSLPDNGHTYAHNLEPANYYLEISAANIDGWTVTVEVFIPSIDATIPHDQVWCRLGEAGVVCRGDNDYLEAALDECDVDWFPSFPDKVVCTPDVWDVWVEYDDCEGWSGCVGPDWLLKLKRWVPP